MKSATKPTWQHLKRSCRKLGRTKILSVKKYVEPHTSDSSSCLQTARQRYWKNFRGSNDLSWLAYYVYLEFSLAWGLHGFSMELPSWNLSWAHGGIFSTNSMGFHETPSNGKFLCPVCELHTIVIICIST